MDIRHVLEFDSDSSTTLTYGEAMARYKAGSLDPKLKEQIDSMIASSLESFNLITKAAIESLNVTIEPFLNAQKSWYESHRLQIEKALASVSHHADWFQRLDEPLQGALLVLGENGWFLCM